MPDFFISGTDTGAGKTLIATTLLTAFNEKGCRTLGLKPLASGCTATPHGWGNDDAWQLHAAASLTLPYDEINPFAFDAAIAPHIAAQREQRSLDATQIAKTCQRTLRAHAYDVSITEGVGGWLVPLNEKENVSDLARLLNFPVILVVGLRLGCLNHALLTVDVMSSHRIPLVGWIGSTIDPDMCAVEENINTLKQRITAPCLGIVPFLQTPSPHNAMPYIDISPLQKTHDTLPHHV